MEQLPTVPPGTNWGGLRRGHPSISEWNFYSVQPAQPTGHGFRNVSTLSFNNWIDMSRTLTSPLALSMLNSLPMIDWSAGMVIVPEKAASRTPLRVPSEAAIAAMMYCAAAAP